jgi:hypothetical protein
MRGERTDYNQAPIPVVAADSKSGPAERQMIGEDRTIFFIVS